MSVLYQQSLPVFVKYLKNLSSILDKGAKFAVEKGIGEEELLKSRLAPDMRGLPYQVQSCCNIVKFAPARIGGIADTHFLDDETTFPQLQDRITATIELLNGVPKTVFDGKESDPVFMPSKMGTFKFETAQSYISDYTIPYFHFHLSSAYCILRHLGVEIGAFDYLGRDTFVKVE